MNSPQRANDEPERTSARKPYMKPELQIFGDLREITRAVGSKGKDDGGMAGVDKTSIT